MKTLAKQAAGKAAANLVQNGMCVGLGSGSTVACVIDALIERARQGLRFDAVAASQTSYNQAIAGGLPLFDPSEIAHLDITLDGADEIDPKKRMIKGGGGALLREKILAACSDEMVVVIDAQKRVAQLGKFPLPLEIATFAYQATLAHLLQLGLEGELRKNQDGQTYMTENGNYLYDIHFHPPFEHLEKLDVQIRSIPGVIETGFFIGLAGRVVVGFNDGKFEILP